MNLQQALAITGRPSWPTKMPDLAYGWPVCNIGDVLARKKGTVCSVCYAKRSHYIIPTVKAAYERRAAALLHPQWVEAMVVVIDALAKEPYFRWCDNGDIWAPWVYDKVLQVSAALPDMNFWLPTQERKTVRRYGKEAIPPNLVVRISGVFPDGPKDKRWPWTSGTTRKETKVTCPADLRKPRQCPSWCRKCWDRGTAHVWHQLKYGGKTNG